MRVLKIFSVVLLTIALFMFATACNSSVKDKNIIKANNVTEQVSEKTTVQSLSSTSTSSTTKFNETTNKQTTITSAKPTIPSKTTTTTKIYTTKNTTTKKTTTTTKKPKTTTTTKKITTTTTQAKTFSQNIKPDSSFVNEAKTIINKYRKEAGSSPLFVDSNMVKLANVRAEEISRQYSHTRPDGRKSYTVYDDYSITAPLSVAENIAMAYRFEDAADVLSVWMDSPDHKKNIVNGKYKRFGIAMYTADNGKMYSVLLLGN